MRFQNLSTVWGEKLDESKVLTEYPRPQLIRDSYLCLNGEWDFAITKSKKLPDRYDSKILVPFSPESSLSKINKKIKADEYLHYRKIFTLPEKFNKGRVLLNFGAVDMFCGVYLNGEKVGSNSGGYYPFTVELTGKLRYGKNYLSVIVKDYTDRSYYTRGKQNSRRGGIWYTPQSGIWQTVWLESVPSQYIKDLKIIPDFDDGTVTFAVEKVGVLKNLKYSIFDAENKKIASGACGDTETVNLLEFTEWSPEAPFLYKVFIESETDKVESYFGMRKFSIGEHNGKKCFMLNNKPYFVNGLLDQGYWSDGMYTAPSDDALIYDIEKTKELGFNTLRKHIKIEPLRWYYHCDRLGMLVIQDMPSGGVKYNPFITQIIPFLGGNLSDQRYCLFGRRSAKSRKLYLAEYHRMLNLLRNVVSLAIWTPFNEGWGQFDSCRIARWTKNHDKQRLVDHASGWHDQGGGDFKSIHIYFKPVPSVTDERPILLSEFGGYSFKENEHSFNVSKTFGYKVLDSREKLQEAYVDLYENQIIPKLNEGLSGAIYTQLSDVEDEVNGIFTYDRKVIKIDETVLKEINEKLKF